MSYNPSSDTGYVRLLISDVSDVDPVFSDGDIQAFLANNRGPKRAAAQALLTLAGNEALLAKKITTQDLSTDGPAVAAELRAQAMQLRKDADQDDTEDPEAWGFEIVQQPRHHRPELTEYQPYQWPWP